MPSKATRNSQLAPPSAQASKKNTPRDQHFWGSSSPYFLLSASPCATLPSPTAHLSRLQDRYLHYHTGHRKEVTTMRSRIILFTAQLHLPLTGGAKNGSISLYSLPSPAAAPTTLQKSVFTNLGKLVRVLHYIRTARTKQLGFLSSVRFCDVEEASEAKIALIHQPQASSPEVSAGGGAMYAVARQPTEASLV